MEPLLHPHTLGHGFNPEGRRYISFLWFCSLYPGRAPRCGVFKVAIPTVILNTESLSSVPTVAEVQPRMLLLHIFKLT